MSELHKLHMLAEFSYTVGSNVQLLPEVLFCNVLLQFERMVEIFTLLMIISKSLYLA